MIHDSWQYDSRPDLYGDRAANFFIHSEVFPKKSEAEEINTPEHYPDWFTPDYRGYPFIYDREGNLHVGDFQGYHYDLIYSKMDPTNRKEYEKLVAGDKGRYDPEKNTYMMYEHNTKPRTDVATALQQHFSENPHNML